MLYGCFRHSGHYTDGCILSVNEMCIQPLIRKSPWKTHGRVWQTFEQSKYKMQRLNFFVVQHSLEWNTVMQIGRRAAIMGERYGLGTVWLRTSPSLYQSFDSQISSPTFLSLCSFTVFREIRGGKQLGRIEAFFYLQHWVFFCHLRSRSS